MGLGNIEGFWLPFHFQACVNISNLDGARGICGGENADT